TVVQEVPALRSHADVGAARARSDSPAAVAAVPPEPETSSAGAARAPAESPSASPRLSPHPRRHSARVDDEGAHSEEASGPSPSPWFGRGATLVRSCRSRRSSAQRSAADDSALRTCRVGRPEPVGALSGCGSGWRGFLAVVAVKDCAARYEKQAYRPPP